MNAGQIVLLASYLATSAVMVGCGVPLYRRKIGRNNWFGFRTKLTMSENTIWFAANRVAGFWLIVTGIGTAVSAIAVTFVGLNDVLASTLVTGGLMAGITICLVASFTEQRRIAEERQWNDSSDLEPRSHE